MHDTRTLPKLQHLVLLLKHFILFGVVTFLPMFGFSMIAVMYDNTWEDKFLGFIILSPIAIFIGVVLSVLGLVMSRHSIQKMVRESFSDLQFLTPAGELCTFSGMKMFGNNMDVVFADGNKMTYPVEALRPSQHNIDPGSYKFGFQRKSTDHHFSLLMFLSIAAMGLFYVYRWLMLESAVAELACMYIAGLIVVCGIGYFSALSPETKSFTFLELASLCRWRTKDGRVGTVRAAEIEGGAPHIERITLRLDDGTTKRFLRGELTMIRPSASASGPDV
jgi:hypothetical protein